MKLPGLARTTIDPTDASTGAGEPGALESTLSGFSRRLLLTKGSLTVVAAGVATAIPALPSAVNTAEADAPEVESVAADAEGAAEPLIAQVKNVHTGEVSLFRGEHEFSVIDRKLAARLFNAAK